MVFLFWFYSSWVYRKIQQFIVIEKEYLHWHCNTIPLIRTDCRNYWKKINASIKVLKIESIFNNKATRFVYNLFALELKKLVIWIWTKNLKLTCTTTDQTWNARGQNCCKNQESRTGALLETCVWLITWMPIEKEIMKKMIVKYIKQHCV